MNTVPPPRYGQSLPPTGAPAPEPSPRERIARFKSLARRGLGYWKMAALILLVGCGVALFVAMRVKLIYRSECVVLFKPALKTSDRQEEESPSERAAKMAPKLKEVLTTRSRFEGIIKEFGLYPKVVESKGMVEAVDEMRGHVGFRGRDSETFVISFENESAELAQKVTQRLADTMIDEFTKSSVSSARQQTEFIAVQEARSEQELEGANKALATFLTVHPEFAVEAKGGSAFGPAGPGAGAMPFMPSLPKDPAAMGDPQLAVLFRQKARLEEEVRNGSGTPVAAPPAPGAAASAERIARLTAARDEAAKFAASAQSDLAEKRTKLTDAHPDVIAAKSQADAAARQLHQAEVQLATAQAVLSGANANPYDPPPTNGNADLQKRLAAIDAQIGARRSVMQKSSAPAAVDGGGVAAAPVTNELVELETEWQRLLRVLHDVKGEHDDLKQRLERAKLQSSAAEAAGGDQMQMLDPAYKPMRPSQGGRTKTAMMGGIMALLLALGYAFSRVFFDDTIIDEADVEALRLIPVLGVLPKVRGAPVKKAAAPPKEAPGAV
jgi:uncharacterized protein involved in exopolysaccharide biosynthesis